MGKKHKTNQINIDGNLQTARMQAYDASGIAKKKLELDTSKRKKMSSNLLRLLLQERVYEDSKLSEKETNNNYTRAMHQKNQMDKITKKFLKGSQHYLDQVCTTLIYEYFAEQKGSLAFASIGTIAENLQLYDPSAVKETLRRLPSEGTEYFSILATLYDSISDEYLEVLHSTYYARFLFIGPKITYVGLHCLLNESLQETGNIDMYEVEDSWENTNVSFLELPKSSISSLKGLYLVGCQLMPHCLHDINQCYKNLRTLFLHSVGLTSTTTKHHSSSSPSSSSSSFSLSSSASAVTDSSFTDREFESKTKESIKPVFD